MAWNCGPCDVALGDHLVHLYVMGHLSGAACLTLQRVSFERGALPYWQLVTLHMHAESKSS